jgi:hypothetical protein
MFSTNPEPRCSAQILYPDVTAQTLNPDVTAPNLNPDVSESHKSGPRCPAQILNPDVTAQTLNPDNFITRYPAQILMFSTKPTGVQPHGPARKVHIRSAYPFQVAADFRLDSCDQCFPVVQPVQTNKLVIEREFQWPLVALPQEVLPQTLLR